VLILDEVMTGFRVNAGGAQSLYGVTPDLTVLGKIIGGGLPVGAFAGGAEIMSQIAPSGPIRDALDYRARFPDGRIGSDPAQASPEKGRTIIDASVAALLKDVADFSAEVLPEV
jgi:hypothetical protein